jgi:hypothetical protein
MWREHRSGPQRCCVLVLCVLIIELSVWLLRVGSLIVMCVVVHARAAVVQNHTVLMVLPDWRTNPTYPGAEWYEQVWKKHEYGTSSVEC